MVRLVIALVVAAALWPVDENNQPLALGNVEISTEAIYEAGASVLGDVSRFCVRNPETCSAASEFVSETVSEIRLRVSEALAEDETQASSS